MMPHFQLKHVVSPDVQTQSLPKGLQLQVDSSMAMYKYTHQIPNLKLETQAVKCIKW